MGPGQRHLRLMQALPPCPCILEHGLEFGQHVRQRLADDVGLHLGIG